MFNDIEYLSPMYLLQRHQCRTLRAGKISCISGVLLMTNRCVSDDRLPTSARSRNVTQRNRGYCYTGPSS